VIIADSSLSRNPMGPETSAVVAHRPSGICERKGARFPDDPVEGGHVVEHDSGVDAIYPDRILAELQS